MGNKRCLVTMCKRARQICVAARGVCESLLWPLQRPSTALLAQHARRAALARRPKGFERRNGQLLRRQQPPCPCLGATRLRNLEGMRLRRVRSAPLLHTLHRRRWRNLRDARRGGRELLPGKVQLSTARVGNVTARPAAPLTHRGAAERVHGGRWRRCSVALARTRGVRSCEAAPQAESVVCLSRTRPASLGSEAAHAPRLRRRRAGHAPLPGASTCHSQSWPGTATRSPSTTVSPHRCSASRSRWACASA